MARRSDDDDEAPWLAEVENMSRESTFVSRGKLLGGLVFGLLLLTLVALGIYLVANKKQGGADGIGGASPGAVPLIAADPGPYKVPPSDPGGMTVEGTGQTVYSAGGGDDPGGQIDVNRTPEEVLPRPGSESAGTAPTDLLPPAMGGTAAPTAVAPQPAAPPAAPAAKPEVALPAKPAAPPGVAAPGPRTLQLGAFSTAAKAEAAWTALSGRYAYLAPLAKRIEPVARDGGTLYRLRATGSADHAAALDLCARLKVAGDSCMVTE